MCSSLFDEILEEDNLSIPSTKNKIYKKNGKRGMVRLKYDELFLFEKDPVNKDNTLCILINDDSCYYASLISIDTGYLRTKIKEVGEEDRNSKIIIDFDMYSIYKYTVCKINDRWIINRDY
jgi:hypothetical protein